MKRSLYAAIALDGQIPDDDVIMRAVDEWLREAGKEPRTAWHKRQETWGIEPWLEVLPYTTKPGSVVGELTKVKAFYGDGRAQRWERVLKAVAAAPGARGEALLAALARAHHDIAGDFEWLKAILERDSAEAVRLYPDLFSEGVVGQQPGGIDAWYVGRELAAYVRKFLRLKADLKARHGTANAVPIRAVLEHLFGEVGTEDDLVAMVS